MKKRMLRDIEVSELGMGCMAFSHGYGQIPPEKYSIEAIQNTYKHGCSFFDTAEVYSPNLAGIGHNERIVGKALKEVREKVVIATKLMLHSFSIGSVYKTIRKHLEGSLDRLQIDYVDACGIIGLNQESPINTGFERFGPFSLTRKAG